MPILTDSTSHKRIDDDVHITIFIPLTDEGVVVAYTCIIPLSLSLSLSLSVSAECDNSSCTTVRGCIDISAPSIATPARHPQIPNTDFSFGTRVLQ